MRLLVTIASLVVCLSLSAQKDKYFTSKWRDNSSESPGPPTSDYVSSKKGEVLYCVTNDDKNIYVDVKITESIEQGRVLQMGMTVWVNEDGKPRKITGIRFPIGAQYSRVQGRRGETQDPFSRVSPLSQANTIELVGFKGVQPARFPSDNTDNIRGSIKYDNDGNLVYSLTIPFSKLPSAKTSMNLESVPMTMAIEYGAPPVVTERSGMTATTGGTEMTGGRSGGGGRGGGGAPGGGAPGGGATGGSAVNQDTPKPVIFWLKDIKLAEKK